jgi:hypothetical protein
MTPPRIQPDMPRSVATGIQEGNFWPPRRVASGLLKTSDMAASV